MIRKIRRLVDGKSRTARSVKESPTERDDVTLHLQMRREKLRGILKERPKGVYVS